MSNLLSEAIIAGAIRASTLQCDAGRAGKSSWPNYSEIPSRKKKDFRSS